MDEIEKRLREAADACITSYDAWRKNQKEGGTREALMEAMHELRKIAARLEIEIAVSERDEMTSKPIPIPPHRSSRPMSQGGRDNFADDNIGNAADYSGGNSSSGGGGFQGPRDNNRGGGSGGGQHRRRRMGMGGQGGGHQGGGSGNGNGPRTSGGDEQA